MWGCTDPTAVNFNPGATCDNESCEYPSPELLYIDYDCNLNCNDTLAWYDAIVFFENVGNTTITNFCIEWDIIGFNQEFIECFEGELLPGEDITIEFSNITSDGGGGIIIRLLELNGEATNITWSQPTDRDWETSLDTQWQSFGDDNGLRANSVRRVEFTATSLRTRLGAAINLDDPSKRRMYLQEAARQRAAELAPDVPTQAASTGPDDGNEVVIGTTESGEEVEVRRRFPDDVRRALGLKD